MTLFKEENFIQPALQSTIKAAIACSKFAGNGDKTIADKAAVDAMRDILNSQINDCGIVIIGEGEMDEAPMLYIGEKIGQKKDQPQHNFEIAVDPLDGTTLCAKNMDGAVAVIAIAPAGCILNAPDIYMHKIAVGGYGLSNDIISFDNTTAQNLQNIAKAKKKDIKDLNIVVLDRPRHAELISQIREAGAKVSLLNDGDVMGVLSICEIFKNRADAYFGIGGAPEGVVTAAAIRALGGVFIGKLFYEDDSRKQRASAMLKTFGYNNPDQVFTQNDMIKGDKAVFALTAVTHSSFLKGVQVKSLNGQEFYKTQSLVATLQNGYFISKNFTKN